MAITDVFRLADAHVLVIGDVILDEYLEGAVHRISPEAPVPVLLQSARRCVLGGAANVAANIVTLGGKATLVGRVGDDAAGREIASVLASIGATDALVVDEDVPTTTKTRVVDRFQQIVRVDRENIRPLAEAHERLVLDALDAFLAGATTSSVVLSDYGKGMLGPRLIGEIIDRCRAADVPVVVDPKSADLARYRGATVLKPNRGESAAAVRAASPELGDPATLDDTELATRTLQLAQVAHVVMSRSEAGVLALGTTLPEPLHIQAAPVAVSDVSGAGDTMVAVIAAGLAVGIPLDRLVPIANLGAGVSCTVRGTAPLPLYALAAAYEQAATDRGVVDKFTDDVALLGRYLAALHREGRRIVFTNGCFDVFHAGHAALLARARSFGDVLVVGLNDDASVARLKGPSRPVNGLADRAAVLAALSAVDIVVPFAEDTPLELVLALRPDVLVKGGDYDADTIVGSREVRGWGGTVEIVPTLEGRSSTSIIERSG